MTRRPLARAFLLASLAILATLVWAGPAAAGDFRSGTTVSIGPDETVDDDLYVGGGTISIAGTVNGDASVAGGTVTLTGTVDGSLNVSGGTVDVLGEVAGAVRVTGGTIRIQGTVGRDLVIFGGTATIEPDAEISGDVAGGTGSLTVGGTVGGDVLAASGTIRISGTVDGSVEVGVGELVIESGAVVNGDVLYRSDRDAQISDGAEIGGTVERTERGDDGGPTEVITDNPVVSYLGLLLGLLILGWGLLAIRPRLVIGSAVALETAPLPALGLGCVALVGQFIVLVILVAIGITIGLLAGALGGAFAAAAFVVLLLIILLVILSAIPVAMAIGGLVLRGDRSPYLAYLAGAAILSLAILVAGFIPALGGLVFLVIWILGLGAYTLYLWRTRNQPYLPPPATAPAAPAASA
jgi:cytoskeletal protein CcmA (bactofilin family)